MADEAPDPSAERASEKGQSEAQRAVAAQRIAALVLAQDDDDLAELQRSGFAPERTPTRERLAEAKALVDHLGRALETNIAADWHAVEAAAAALDDVVAEAVPTDGDGGVATLSTDVPPPLDVGSEPTQRGDAAALAAHLSSPAEVDASALREPVSGPVPPGIPEETMVSAVPVAAMVSELTRRARMAELAQANEHTMVEAGMTEGAKSQARAFLDRSEGGTVQLGFSSMAHGFALTVEEYAALCAERDEDPSRLRALRARYGIPEVRGHAALDRYFEQLFVRDPAKKTQWQRDYQRYVALVRERVQT